MPSSLVFASAAGAADSSASGDDSSDAACTGATSSLSAGAAAATLVLRCGVVRRVTAVDGVSALVCLVVRGHGVCGSSVCSAAAVSPCSMTSAGSPFTVSSTSGSRSFASATMRLRITDGMRRICRTRTLVDANGAETPDWNTLTSFNRSSPAVPERDDESRLVVNVGEQILESARLVFREAIEQLLDANFDGNLLGRRQHLGPRLRALDDGLKRREQPEQVHFEFRFVIVAGDIGDTLVGRCHCAARSCSRSCSSSAAALNFWCSSSRRTSTSRGSSSSPSSSEAVSGRGSSIFDLMWMSVAAITRNSPAMSRSSSCINRRVEILRRDERDRNVVDVDLIAFDEVQQQIEGPSKLTFSTRMGSASSC